MTTTPQIEVVLRATGIKLEWEWDEARHVYVDTETGEVIEHDTMIEYRNSIAGFSADRYATWPIEEEEPDDSNLVALLLLGLLTLTAWEMAMREAITATVTAQYALGRGGFGNMGDLDWSDIEDTLLTQFQFLNAFSIAMSLGELSEFQIAARARLYFSATVQAFERGRANSYDYDLNLTVWPGDGTSICQANDRCFWSIDDLEDTIEARWIRTALESCATCVSRAACPEVEFIKATGEHTGLECYEVA